MLNIKHRSTRSQMFFKIGAVKNFSNFTGKLLLWEKKLQHSCFPLKFAKLLECLFLQNISGGCFCKHSFIELIYTSIFFLPFNMFLKIRVSSLLQPFCHVLFLLLLEENHNSVSKVSAFASSLRPFPAFLIWRLIVLVNYWN